MKNKKIFKKVFAVLVITSILLSLFLFVCSADGGQIGNGSYEIGGDKFYTTAPADHGLPFDITYFGMAQGFSSSPTDAQLANNFSLNNFGVTYAPNAMGVTSYLSDQYPRVEMIPTPSVFNAFPKATMPFVYAYYDLLDVYQSVWYNMPLTYSYSSFIVNPSIAYGLQTSSQDISSSIDYAIEEGYGGQSLLYESNAVNTVTFSYSGQLSPEYLLTLNDNDNCPYAPYSFTVYNLMPVSFFSSSVKYSITVNGYRYSAGEIEELSYRATSNDDVFGWSDYFSTLNSITPDSSQFTIKSLAYYYDSVYGLDIVPTQFNFTEGFSAFLNSVESPDWDVITSINISFGSFYGTDNSKILEYYNSCGSYPKIGGAVKYYDVLPYTQSWHREKVLSDATDSINANGVPAFSLHWLGNTIAGVMDVDLFGSFGIGDILFVVIGIGVFIAFLKIFAGG